jgi:hypothetical protein
MKIPRQLIAARFVQLQHCFRKTMKKNESKENDVEDELNEKIKKLSKRLVSVKDDDVINAIYLQSRAIYEKEHERSPSIDSKGSSLLSACAVAISLVLTIGGLFLKEVKNTPAFFISNPVHLFSAMYIIVGATLFISMIVCLMSLRSRKDFRAITEEDVIDADEITHKLEHYQRYIATAYWKFYLINLQINNKKATTLMIAQLIFIFANLILLFMMIMFGLYIYNVRG